MILVADSGSSKTDWLVLTDKESRIVHSKGLNPVTVSAEEIQEQLLTTFSRESLGNSVSHIHFFGAGCWNEATCTIIEHQLKKCFPSATIDVNSDLLGAIKATCGDQEGITCILGTGSNSSWYDGQQLVDGIPSLGYMIGDEGSGSYLGKQLIRHYFYRELPKEIENAFYHQYQLDKGQLIKHLYHQPAANRYLASFALFLKEQLSHPFIRKVVKDSFKEFLERHVFKYPVYKDVPIHFIGSIAFHFQEVLLELIEAYSLTCGSILEKPILGLEKYYREKK